MAPPRSDRGVRRRCLAGLALAALLLLLVVQYSSLHSAAARGSVHHVFAAHEDHPGGHAPLPGAGPDQMPSKYIFLHRRDFDELRRNVTRLEREVARVRDGPKVFSHENRLDQAHQRILVTGAAGFIGSHLVDQLMVRGHVVYALDNLHTGDAGNLKKWLHHENFHLIVHDIQDPLRLEVDQVYHFASPDSPRFYERDPVNTIKTATRGTINVLGMAKRNRARVLLASSGDVYGDSAENPKTEADWGRVDTLGRRACYEEGKRVGETLAYAYRSQHGLDVRVARIFNVYGPRMRLDDGRVVGTLVGQAIRDEPMTLHGDGLQERSFVYIQDLIRALVRLMHSDHVDPINLGHEMPITINNLAARVRDHARSNSTIAYSHPLHAALNSRIPSTDLAERVLGWRPIVPLDEGIAATIQYYRDHPM